MKWLKKGCAISLSWQQGCAKGKAGLQGLFWGEQKEGLLVLLLKLPSRELEAEADPEELGERTSQYAQKQKTFEVPRQKLRTEVYVWPYRHIPHYFTEC